MNKILKSFITTLSVVSIALLFASCGSSHNGVSDGGSTVVCTSACEGNLSKRCQGVCKERFDAIASKEDDVRRAKKAQEEKLSEEGCVKKCSKSKCSKEAKDCAEKGSKEASECAKKCSKEAKDCAKKCSKEAKECAKKCTKDAKSCPADCSKPCCVKEKVTKDCPVDCKDHCCTVNLGF